VAFWRLPSIVILGVLVYFFLEFNAATFPVPEPNPYGRPGKL
jgi:hypothetical protein